MNAMEAIAQRISVRSYSEQPITDQVRSQLEELCRDNGSGPFGAAVRFVLLDLESPGGEAQKPLGTYGVIRGARYYILGAVKEGKGALEDIGYCMEKIILKATELGFGTCWLGGTFKRSAFAARMQLAADELLPAVTPVGYPSRVISGADRQVRFSAGSNKRKPWNEMFFASDGKTPLTEADAGVYKQALEAVRMGPSASNRQPWRIVKDNHGDFHLFLRENPLYNRIMGKFRLQYIDMGIAMCHFELAARQLGLPGNWKVNGLAFDLPGLHYISTWND